MLGMPESRITIEVPDDTEIDALNKNFTLLVSEIEEIMKGEPETDEKLIADVWVGIVLAFMVLTCASCMCICLMYHRYQLWKRRVLNNQSARDLANIEASDRESLPSYTVVSGLPSYDEALQQMKIQSEKKAEGEKETDPNSDWVPRTPPTPIARLSAPDLYNIYKTTTAMTDQSAENKT